MRRRSLEKCSTLLCSSQDFIKVDEERDGVEEKQPVARVLRAGATHLEYSETTNHAYLTNRGEGEDQLNVNKTLFYYSNSQELS